jgi:hypothetical protein
MIREIASSTIDSLPLFRTTTKAASWQTPGVKEIKQSFCAHRDATCNKRREAVVDFHNQCNGVALCRINPFALGLKNLPTPAFYCPFLNCLFLGGQVRAVERRTGRDFLTYLYLFNKKRCKDTSPPAWRDVEREHQNQILET